jgi:hypothetical protein
MIFFLLVKKIHILLLYVKKNVNIFSLIAIYNFVLLYFLVSINRYYFYYYFIYLKNDFLYILSIRIYTSWYHICIFDLLSMILELYSIFLNIIN